MKAKLDIAVAEQQLSLLNEEMERFWDNLVLTWQNPLLNAIPEEAIYDTLEWGIYKLDLLPKTTLICI
jgi:hypothetical protein